MVQYPGAVMDNIADKDPSEAARQDAIGPQPMAAPCPDPSAPSAPVTLDDTDHALRLALGLSPLATLMIAHDRRITFANSAAQALLCLPADALTGRDVISLIAKSKDRDALRDQLCQTVSHSFARPLALLQPEGAPLDVQIGLTPSQIRDAAVTYVTLRPHRIPGDSQTHLADALNAAGAAIMMVTEEGTIELVNNAACRLLAGRQDQLVGTCVDDYVPDLSREAHARYRKLHTQKARHHAMAGGRSLKALARNGRQTSVEITLSQIDFPDQPRVLVTLVDITNRLEHEREMTARNDHLAALNEELTQFAYSASHDLRAPLATISGLLELCLEDLDAGEIREAHHNINEALKTSRRNIHKVEAVLTLARAGLSPVPEEDIDLPSLVASCWDDMHAEGRAKPAITIEMDGPPIVRTERQTLCTVIENVLSNACRFQDAGKPENWVQVRLRTLNNAVSILIGDNGIGIPEADQPRIFEMFRRSTLSQGHGLGLALVQKNVLRLSGTITLCSTPERTDFIFSFPQMEVRE